MKETYLNRDFIEKVSNFPIIFTKHVNTPSDAGMMEIWWKELINPEHTLAEIIPDFDISKGQVLIKTRYDAFHETLLDDMVRQHGAEQVIITGVMTHLCCETTARSAFIHGYDVIVPSDATATYNAAFHLSSLTNLAHGFATNIPSREIEDLYGSRHLSDETG